MRRFLALLELCPDRAEKRSAFRRFCGHRGSAISDYWALGM
jgi:hypothetical protein